MLEVKNLSVSIHDKPILDRLNLTVKAGQVAAIMGPNGSGKSTLSYVIAGKPDYEVTGGEVLLDGENLLELDPNERAAKGVFLAFQYPIEIPGVATMTFLKAALNAQRRGRGEKDVTRALAILDSLTAEEREWVPDWKNDYEMYGMDAMQQLYTLHDSQTIQHIIDRAPDDLRAKMVLSLLEVPEVRKDRAYAITTLSESHRTLEKFPTGNPATYLELCNDYAELLPEEAPQVFGFAVVQLNHIEYQDFEKERKEKPAVHKERPAFAYYKPGLWLQPIDIRGSLIDNDEPYISAAIKTIKDPETRISLRISFLRFALKRYEQELNKPVAAPRARAAATPSGVPK